MRPSAALLSLVLILNPIAGATDQPRLTETKSQCLPGSKSSQQAARLSLEELMAKYGGELDPPTLGGLKMPKLLWWYTLIAAEVTGANPEDVASVMRHESDFRCGPIGRGTYIGPMGIKCKDFQHKYPIHDTFGNVLTGARRLAMFKSLSAALPKYNMDRSPAFYRYCRDVLAGAKEAKKHVKVMAGDPAWERAVRIGTEKLAALEIHAANYAARRH